MSSYLQDDRDVVLKANLLGGVRIALAIGGGIAATEAVRLIRVLRRYGARVRVYVGRGGLRFITETSLVWASGEPIVTEADAIGGGTAEHLFREDVLLVAPATLNIIAKAALGIGDSLVTTLLASALGRMALEREEQETVGAGLVAPLTRVVMAASMHQSLQANPLLSTHQTTLTGLGVHWVMPRVAEGKLKSPVPEALALAVMRSVAHRDRSAVFGKRVFITAGSVPSYLDNIRMLTNIASGRTGLELAVYAHALGAEVTLLIERGKEQSSVREELFSVLDFPFRVVLFHDYHAYHKQTFQLLKEVQPDLGIFTAAVSDYKAKHFTNGKLPSDTLAQIELDITEKIVRKVRKDCAGLKVVAFKLEAKLSVAELLRKGEAVLVAEDYAMLVANRLEDLSAFQHGIGEGELSTSVATEARTTNLKGDAGTYKRYLIRVNKEAKGEFTHTPLSTNFELAQHLFGYFPDATT